MNTIHRLFLAGIVLACSGCANPGSDPLPLSSETYEMALAVLQSQANSGSPEARANCMEALQPARDPRAMETIEQGLHDREWVVRFAAVMASAERKAASVRPVLNTLVEHDPNQSVRVACVYALWRLGDGARVGQLAVTLASPDPAVRANTALVLGRMGETSAIRLLATQRNDADVRVRFEITAAMARLGDEAAQRVIVSECMNKFAEDQYSAMAVCADLPSEIGESPLLLGLEDAPPKLPPDVDPSTVAYLTTCRQLVAARSLAKLRYNNRRAAEVAIDNRTSAFPVHRALAALALGDMLTSREAMAMDGMLKDTDESVRRATAAAIVNIYARAARGS